MSTVLLNEEFETLVAVDLTSAELNTEYVIRDVVSLDDELKEFLFSLGCYEGETITVMSILSENFVISVKDARYTIDSDLAQAIYI